MSAPFDALEDRLLRGGVAPRRVKRFLRELDEHLRDVTESQASGHAAPADAALARIALGSDDELAAAMMKRQDFRSASARWPWLVFALIPVAALALALPWHILLLLVLEQLSAPALLPSLAEMVLFTGNFILVPSIVLLMVFIARRQRLPLAWPILSAAVICFLSPHWDNGPVSGLSHGFSGLYVLYRDSGVTVRGGFTPIFLSAWRELMAVGWGGLAAQYLVILLPLAWLFRRSGKTTAVA